MQSIKKSIAERTTKEREEIRLAEKRRELQQLNKESKDLQLKKEMMDRMVKQVHIPEVQKRKAEIKRREGELQSWTEQFKLHVQISAECEAATRELFVNSFNSL